VITVVNVKAVVNFSRKRKAVVNYSRKRKAVVNYSRKRSSCQLQS